LNWIGPGLVGLILGAAPEQEVGFDAALAQLAEGRFAAALQAAAAEPDVLRRAQAQVHVRHHAGDLQGALQAALDGLVEVPADPWLLEQATFVAVSLNQGALAWELAERLLARLELEPGLPPEQLSGARALHEQASAAFAHGLERGEALQRARLVALALILGSLLLAGSLARPVSRRASRSR
jgi:hypothetical protein